MNCLLFLWKWWLSITSAFRRDSIQLKGNHLYRVGKGQRELPRPQEIIHQLFLIWTQQNAYATEGNHFSSERYKNSIIMQLHYLNVFKYKGNLCHHLLFLPVLRECFNICSSHMNYSAVQAQQSKSKRWHRAATAHNHCQVPGAPLRVKAGLIFARSHTCILLLYHYPAYCLLKYSYLHVREDSGGTKEHSPATERKGTCWYLGYSSSEKQKQPNPQILQKHCFSLWIVALGEKAEARCSGQISTHG